MTDDTTIPDEAYTEQPGENLNPNGEYWVPTHALPPLEAKIAKLQKRAAKLGSLPITFQITGEREDRIVKYKNDILDPDKRVPIYRTYAKVIVMGEPPKYSGWRLVARLIHPGEAGPTASNIVNVVPGQQCPKHFRTAACRCNHCNKDWIQRRDTYVVVNDTGEYKQVGSNCIADFLGHQSPEKVTAIYQFYADLDAQFNVDPDADDDGDYLGQFRRGVVTVATLRVVEVVASHHRQFGWVSKAQVEKAVERGEVCPPFASIGTVLTALFPHDKYDFEWVRKLTPNAEDKHLAARALAWAKEIDPNTDNTYLYNLRTLTTSPTVSTRTIGQVASVIGAYRRAVETEQKEKHARVSTNHVGVVGEKLTADVFVVGVRSFESDFGVRHMNRFADDEGNTLIWWTGTRTFDEGERVRICGTVKAHDEYKGHKQTVLSRVKELPNDEQAAILSTLSPAAQSMLARATDGRMVPDAKDVAYWVDDYEATVAELERQGWIHDIEDESLHDGREYPAKVWAINDATARLASFVKPTKSKGAKKADAAARKADREKQHATYAALSVAARTFLDGIIVADAAVRVPDGCQQELQDAGFRLHYGGSGAETFRYMYVSHGLDQKHYEAYRKWAEKQKVSNG